MFTRRVSVVIARPRDEVFAFIEDARNRPQWDDSVDSEELTSPEPIGVGTTIRTKLRSMGRDYQYDWRIIGARASEPRDGREHRRPVPDHARLRRRRAGRREPRRVRCHGPAGRRAAPAAAADRPQHPAEPRPAASRGSRRCSSHERGSRTGGPTASAWSWARMAGTLFVRRMGAGPPMTLLHGLPELVARLGEDRAGAGRAARAPDAGLPRLRRLRQAAGPRLLATRAGRPRGGALGPRGRDRHGPRGARLRRVGRSGAAGAARRRRARRRPPGGPPPERRPLPGRASPAADPARAARPGAGPADQRDGDRGAVRGGTSGHVRRGLRRERRQRRHLGRHEPRRRPPHLAIG